MTCLRILALTTTIGAFAADRPLLEFQSEIRHFAEDQAIVQIPVGEICQRLEVRLPPSIVGALNSQSFKLHLVILPTDGRRNESDITGSATEQNGSVVLSGSTGKPLGFFGGGAGNYEVRVINSSPYPSPALPRWRIQVWKGAYWDISRSSDSGPAPDVRIDEPYRGAFVFTTRPKTVKIAGSITPDGDYSVRIAGRAASRAMGRSGWGFEQTVDLSGDMKEIEVRAQSADGATRILYLPVN